MIDLDDLIRDGLAEDARRARFDQHRWARSVTELPAPHPLMHPSHRRVARNLAAVAAAVLLLAAVVVPLALLSRLGTGSREVRPGGPAAIDRYGIRIDVPKGWDGRAFQSGDIRYLLLANFEIPEGVGFASDLRDRLDRGRMTVFLQELTEQCPCPGFDLLQDPPSIGPFDITALEGVPSGHALARRTFTVHDRWFELWVEFGTEPAPAPRVSEVNEALATLRIAPDAGWVTHDDSDDAVTVSTPATWTWREDPVPALGEPRILFAAGTWDFPVGGDCGPEPALRDLSEEGALVWLLDYRFAANPEDFPPHPSLLSLSGRPEVFECATGHPSYVVRFRDGFRYFQLHVALGDEASEATRRDAIDVLNTVWPLPLPEGERLARAIELCDRLVWAECPLADWVRNTIWEAGFSVDGRTDSAIVGNADGRSFYMWTTTDLGDPLEPAYVPLMRVDNVTVFSGGTQAVWEARGIRVWVEAGPTDELLPSRKQIGALVRASLTTPL